MEVGNRLVVIAFASVLWISGSHAERVRYDNYRVYTVNATDVGQLALLKALDGSSDSLIFLDGVHALGKSINVVIAPHKVPDFLQTLDSKQIHYELIEENVQEKLEIGEITSRSKVYQWTSYHKLEDTYDWMKGLQETYPKLVKLVTVGKTFEGRSILGVKLSYKSGNPVVFVEGGMHAREWISPATVTYILNELLTSENDELREIAENYDWYFVPHANPDGYVYTHNKDRMWRKTRSSNNGICYGADPNRNWGFHWKEVGASSQPCSDTYAGSRAFSEVETRSLSKYIASLAGRLHLYLSFHSYSQFFLYPYGHTGELPTNHEDLEQIFDVVKEAVSKRYKTPYTGGNVYDAIYPAAGSSMDWAYGVLGVNLSFCYELRPSSNSQLWNGFILPPEQIIPTGEETLDSIVALIGKAKTLGYF